MFTVAQLRVDMVALPTPLISNIPNIKSSS
jgi:hypothetical protein